MTDTDKRDAEWVTVKRTKTGGYECPVCGASCAVSWITGHLQEHQIGFGPNNIRAVELTVRVQVER